MITRAGTLNPVTYPKYPPKLKLHEYEDNNEEAPFTTLQRRVHCLLDVNHIINAIISSRLLELIKGEIMMWLNMLKR